MVNKWCKCLKSKGQLMAALSKTQIMIRLPSSSNIAAMVISCRTGFIVKSLVQHVMSGLDAVILIRPGPKGRCPFVTHIVPTNNATMATQMFKPALIVVDVQEDFCPPVIST
jgi:hypothetical protein